MNINVFLLIVFVKLSHETLVYTTSPDQPKLQNASATNPASQHTTFKTLTSMESHYDSTTRPLTVNSFTNSSTSLYTRDLVANESIILTISARTREIKRNNILITTTVPMSGSERVNEYYTAVNASLFNTTDVNLSSVTTPSIESRYNLTTQSLTVDSFLNSSTSALIRNVSANESIILANSKTSIASRLNKISKQTTVNKSVGELEKESISYVAGSSLRTTDVNQSFTKTTLNVQHVVDESGDATRLSGIVEAVTANAVENASSKLAEDLRHHPLHHQTGFNNNGTTGLGMLSVYASENANATYGAKSETNASTAFPFVNVYLKKDTLKDVMNGTLNNINDHFDNESLIHSAEFTPANISQSNNATKNDTSSYHSLSNETNSDETNPVNGNGVIAGGNTLITLSTKNASSFEYASSFSTGVTSFLTLGKTTLEVGREQRKLVESDAEGSPRVKREDRVSQGDNILQLFANSSENAFVCGILPQDSNLIKTFQQNTNYLSSTTVNNTNSTSSNATNLTLNQTLHSLNRTTSNYTEINSISTGINGFKYSDGHNHTTSNYTEMNDNMAANNSFRNSDGLSRNHHFFLHTNATNSTHNHSLHSHNHTLSNYTTAIGDGIKPAINLNTAITTLQDNTTINDHVKPEKNSNKTNTALEGNTTLNEVIKPEINTTFNLFSKHNATNLKNATEFGNSAILHALAAFHFLLNRTQTNYLKNMTSFFDQEPRHISTPADCNATVDNVSALTDNAAKLAITVPDVKTAEKNEFMSNNKSNFKFPWLAEVYHLNKSVCLAVIVAKSILLTAPDCLFVKTNFKNTNDFHVQLSDGSSLTNLTMIPLQMKKAEGFRNTLFPKFVAIRLKEQLVFGDLVAPVCMPSKDARVSNSLFVAKFSKPTSNGESLTIESVSTTINCSDENPQANSNDICFKQNTTGDTRYLTGSMIFGLEEDRWHLEGLGCGFHLKPNYTVFSYLNIRTYI